MQRYQGQFSTINIDTLALGSSNRTVKPNNERGLGILWHVGHEIKRLAVIIGIKRNVTGPDVEIAYVPLGKRLMSGSWGNVIIGRCCVVRGGGGKTGKMGINGINSKPTLLCAKVVKPQKTINEEFLYWKSICGNKKLLLIERKKPDG